jgi:hypothetical protein
MLICIYNADKNEKANELEKGRKGIKMPTGKKSADKDKDADMQ